MQYLKPLFNIERIHVNGSRLYYELSYKTDNQYTPVVDACFLSWRDAQEFRDNLLELQ